MGYPDDWTKYGLWPKAERSGELEFVNEVVRNGQAYSFKEMSDTRRYKACGNGVVSNVVEEVVRRLYG
jgi:site-specific DNA-cytosine methylase